MPKPKVGTKRIPVQKGSVREYQVLRGHKMVQPACMEMDETYKTLTTGPCQRATWDDVRLSASWFNNCSHGPSEVELEKAGWKGLPPPYFESSYAEDVEDESELQEDGSLKITGQKKTKKKVIRPRVTQVPVSERAMSREGIHYSQIRGCKELSEFDIAPMCEMWNCWSQDVTLYHRLGYFCGDLHAKLVKAEETNNFPMLAWDDASRNERREWLRNIDV